MIQADNFILGNKIKKYKEEIHHRNCSSFVSMAAGGTWVTAAVLMIGHILPAYTSFLDEFAMFFGYMVLLLVIAKLCEYKQVRCIKLIYYIAITPIMLGGILMGTYLDPSRPALTIMIFICVITLFIIDRPGTILLYQMFVVIAFAVCCHDAKPSELFRTDMMNLTICLCIAMGVNYFALRGRVESAENYCMAKHRSETDALTGIYNRGAGEKRVKELIAAGTTGAFVILDIDNFKNINDTQGHQVGDGVIVHLATSLRNTFRPQDVIFRLGGDEFAVFATGMTDEIQCQQRFKELGKSMEKIIQNEEQELSVQVSIGCTICRSENNDFEKMYRSSDDALYHVKSTEKGQCVIVYL